MNLNAAWFSYTHLFVFISFYWINSVSVLWHGFSLFNADSPWSHLLILNTSNTHTSVLLYNATIDKGVNFELIKIASCFVLFGKLKFLCACAIKKKQAILDIIDRSPRRQDPKTMMKVVLTLLAVVTLASAESKLFNIMYLYPVIHWILNRFSTVLTSRRLVILICRRSAH